jgi:hypothetical protein
VQAWSLTIASSVIAIALAAECATAVFTDESVERRITQRPASVIDYLAGTPQALRSRPSGL